MRPFHISKSITSRISMLTAVFLIVSVVFSSLMSGLIFVRLTTDRLNDGVFNHLRALGNNIDVSMENTEFLSQSVARTINYKIQSTPVTNESLRQTLNNVVSVPYVSRCGLCLDSSRFAGTNIEAPFVFDGECMYVHGSRYSLQEAPETFNQICARHIGLWNQDAYHDFQDTVGTATYVCSVTDTNGDLWGVLVMQLSHKHIRHIVQQSMFSVNSFNELCNRNGLMLMSTGTDNIKGTCVLEHLQEMGVDEPLEAARVILSRHKGVVHCSINQQKGYYYFMDVPHTNWIVSTFIPVKDVIGVDVVLRYLLLLLGLIAIIVVAIFFTHSLVQRNLIPLSNLTEAAEHLAKQDFDYPLPELFHEEDEVANLTRSFNQMRVDLLSTIEREKLEIKEHERINKEVELARNIQVAMLPRYQENHPFAECHDFYAYMRPALEVGGDLYHFHYYQDNFLFSIGDVSGKGVPSAICMSQIMSQLRHISLGENSDYLRDINLVNRTTCMDNAVEMFTTLTMARLNLTDGNLSLVNAGHERPIAIGPDGEPHWLEVEANLPIGIIEDQEYCIQSFKIEPGTMLFFYTDGVTEAVDENKNLYGKDRLMAILKGANMVRPHQVVKRVQFDIDEFAAGAPQGDDITMFAILYKG